MYGHRAPAVVEDRSLMPALFAQSLGEYGGLASLASGLQQLTYSISVWLGSVRPTTWIITAVVVVGLVMLTRR